MLIFGAPLESLPLILDTDEAIDYFNQHPNCTDAIKAYIVAFLFGEGLENADIRTALNIEKIYFVSHLKRAGTLLSEEELELWHNNSRVITLGHVRAVSKLPFQTRDKLLRDLVEGRGGKGGRSVSRYESIARSLLKGEAIEKDVDIKRYEELMQSVTGRVTKIRFNHAKQSGTISLDFFSLDSLDDIAKALGFNAEDHGL